MMKNFISYILVLFLIIASFYYADKIETDSAMDFGIIYSYPDISKNSAVLTLSYADAFIQAINGFEILLNSNFVNFK